MRTTTDKTKARKSSSKAVAVDERVALTLKLDSKTYMRLSVLRARERKTAQEILTDALIVYLDRMHA
jgi:hypothetical protein